MAKYHIKAVLKNPHGIHAPVNSSCDVDAKSESEALAKGRKHIEQVNGSYIKSGYAIDTIIATPK